MRNVGVVGGFNTYIQQLIYHQIGVRNMGVAGGINTYIQQFIITK